jgi:3-phosphoshikimate 1-carboxyvinyltransferase
VIEPKATRDHSELMLKFLEADITSQDTEIKLHGQPELIAKDIIVPSDPSSAAFFVVASLIVPGSKLLVKNICLNPLRAGLFEVLKEMGGNIEYTNEREEAGERIADIKVLYSKLHAVTVPAEKAPSMIDEYPILSVAASVAEGTTRMEGLGELRVKESDRLAAIEDGLKQNGVVVSSGEDWLEVMGTEKVAGGGLVNTHLDHRIAMSFLILGAIAEQPVAIDDATMIATSFPNFIELFTKLGGKVS